MSPARHRPPVALFAYRRDEHLRRTLEALRRNNGAAETELTVFADGPRDDADVHNVARVRSVLLEIPGFAGVRVVERRHNLGLARNVLAGVDEILETNESVVVLEDDMLTSVHFLDYMRDALRRYADDDRVVSVHAYQLPLKEKLPETFFLPGADCWGWGTWGRAWRSFQREGPALLRELEQRGLSRAFDFGGAYPYTHMLRDAVAGRVDSWAILWYASAFLQGQLTLYPGRSLVQNIGNDGTGRHGGRSTAFDTPLNDRPVDVAAIPIVADALARDLMARQLVQGRSGGIPGRMRRLVARLVSRQ